MAERITIGYQTPVSPDSHTVAPAILEVDSNQVIIGKGHVHRIDCEVTELERVKEFLEATVPDGVKAFKNGNIRVFDTDMDSFVVVNVVPSSTRFMFYDKKPRVIV
jgi:hypothetical protein